MSRFRRLLPLVALALLAPARGEAQQLSADSVTVLLAKGKTLYEGKGLCSSCHGVNGEGVLGPTLRLTASKPWIHTKGSQAEIVALIKEGVNDQKTKSEATMPPKGGSRLTDAEIELVARYVIDLHSRKEVPAKP